MSMTGKYCFTCGDRLSFLAAKNDDEIKFYWAKLRRHGSVTRQGTCDGCRCETSVTSYLVRDWVTQVVPEPVLPRTDTYAFRNQDTQNI
jgi:hypothetical protein